MKYGLTILALLFTRIVFGQTIVFDTNSKKYPFMSSSYYDKTDFSVIDSLSLWNYALDTTYKGRETDSVKPLGQIIFWRTKAVDDSISKNIYKRPWTPYISFDIFTIKDSSYCYKSSKETRYYSSCIAPDLGGDIIIITKFIFLNHSVCLDCQRYDTDVDYCRPVINYIFSQIDRKKITTIQSLVEQFKISKGLLPKRK